MHALSYADAGEENPPRSRSPSLNAEGLPAYAPAPPGATTAPARAPVRRTRTNRSSAAAGSLCVILVCLIALCVRRSRLKAGSKLFVAVHGVYAGFIYEYAHAEAYPLPRGPFNHTNRGYNAFQAFMYILCVPAALSLMELGVDSRQRRLGWFHRREHHRILHFWPAVAQNPFWLQQGLLLSRSVVELLIKFLSVSCLPSSASCSWRFSSPSSCWALLRHTLCSSTFTRTFVRTTG